MSETRASEQLKPTQRAHSSTTLSSFPLHASLTPLDSSTSRAYDDSSLSRPSFGQRSKSMYPSTQGIGADIGNSEAVYEDWFERLGKRASSSFGKWSNESDPTSPVTRSIDLPHTHHNDEDDSDSDDDGQRRRRITRAKEGPSVILERTKSSLSVFHDPYEEKDDDSIHSSSHPPTPASMSRTHSRINSLSAPNSPRNQFKTLEPMTPSVKVSTSSHDNRDEDPTRDILKSQEKWGVFSLVESALEWPENWSSTTLKRNKGSSRSLPVSRVTSFLSLSNLVEDEEALDDRGKFDVLNETTKWNDQDEEMGSTSGTGELSAYYRAKSSGNLSSLKWEDEGSSSSHDVGANEKAKKVEQRASSGSKEEESSRTGIRETIGGLLDTIGLGSFV